METALPLKAVKESTAIVYIFFKISRIGEINGGSTTNAQLATVLFLLFGWFPFVVSPLYVLLDKAHGIVVDSPQDKVEICAPLRAQLGRR